MLYQLTLIATRITHTCEADSLAEALGILEARFRRPIRVTGEPPTYSRAGVPLPWDVAPRNAVLEGGGRRYYAYVGRRTNREALP